jgi:hypothetical protein
VQRHRTPSGPHHRETPNRPPGVTDGFGPPGKHSFQPSDGHTELYRQAAHLVGEEEFGIAGSTNELFYILEEKTVIDYSPQLVLKLKDGACVSLSDVKTVWWRRPQPFL